MVRIDQTLFTIRLIPFTLVFDGDDLVLKYHKEGIEMKASDRTTYLDHDSDFEYMDSDEDEDYGNDKDMDHEDEGRDRESNEVESNTNVVPKGCLVRMTAERVDSMDLDHDVPKDETAEEKALTGASATMDDVKGTTMFISSHVEILC